MARILIIGYGNPLRRDDGLGWIAAEQLAGRLGDRDEVEVITSHQIMPEMSEAISRADQVIFIDAAEGAEPGAITCEPVLPSSDPVTDFSHHLDPPGILQMAQSLFGRAAPALLASVVAKDFGYGEGLSVEIDRELPHLLERIEQALLT